MPDICTRYRVCRRVSIDLVRLCSTPWHSAIRVRDEMSMKRMVVKVHVHFGKVVSRICRCASLETVASRGNGAVQFLRERLDRWFAMQSHAHDEPLLPCERIAFAPFCVVCSR